MKTKYAEASTEVSDLVDKLFNTFPDRFIHIKRADLLLVFKDAPKSTYNAKTRLLNGFYRMLTNKKIVIELWKQGWELDKPSTKALTLYRELYRIDLRDFTQDYKLVKPDIQDFSKILEKVGLHNETVDQFFSSVTPSSTK